MNDSIGAYLTRVAFALIVILTVYFFPDYVTVKSLLTWIYVWLILRV